MGCHRRRQRRRRRDGGVPARNWIRALGARIAKVHLTDFHLDRPNGRFAWTNIGDGDIDRREVRRAFDDARYRGYFTTEVAAGDAAYLKDLAGRVDRFLSGRNRCERSG